MPRLFRMSTQGKDARANAEKGLDDPVDLLPLADLLKANDAPMPFGATGFLWGFKGGVPILTDQEPLSVGDLGVRVHKVGRNAHVTGIYSVVAVFPDNPDVASGAGIQWQGEGGWRTSVIFDSRISLGETFSYAEYMAAYGWVEGFNFRAEFLQVPDLDSFIEDFRAGLRPAQHRRRIDSGSPMPPPRPDPAPATLTVDNSRRRPPPRPGTGTRTARPEQPSFRSEVFSAYRDSESGRIRCAACSVDDERLIEAAHIIDYGRGPERWYNGLPLCRNHHRYFDLWLLKLGADYTWVARPGGPSLAAMGTTRRDLTHYDSSAWRPRPHIDAVRWKFDL